VADATAWVALGSNQGRSRRHLRDAAAALSTLPGTSLRAVSSLYRTPPWGDPDQDDFLNAVACLRTSLEPEPLLDRLLDTERRLGRERKSERRWGPRTIDLDLLLHGAAEVDSPRLVLPHPRLHERAFVLVPLAELDPALPIPRHGTVANCLDGLDRTGIERIEGPGWTGRRG